jgi:hypothetical protein
MGLSIYVDNYFSVPSVVDLSDEDSGYLLLSLIMSLLNIWSSYLISLPLGYLLSESRAQISLIVLGLLVC